MLVLHTIDAYGGSGWELKVSQLEDGSYFSTEKYLGRHEFSGVISKERFLEILEEVILSDRGEIIILDDCLEIFLGENTILSHVTQLGG